jgi:hypothetical protein
MELVKFIGKIRYEIQNSVRSSIRPFTDIKSPCGCYNWGRVITFRQHISLHKMDTKKGFLYFIWALFERSLVVWTLDIFPAFYGTRRFNTEFTRALHLSLSWDKPILSISPHPTSTRSILILSTHLRLGLPSGLFTSRFPTNNLYVLLFSPIHPACPAHLILLAVIIHSFIHT